MDSADPDRAPLADVRVFHDDDDHLSDLSFWSGGDGGAGAAPAPQSADILARLSAIEAMVERCATASERAVYLLGGGSVPVGGAVVSFEAAGVAAAAAAAATAATAAATATTATHAPLLPAGEHVTVPAEPRVVRVRVRPPTCARCARRHIACSHDTPCQQCTDAGSPCVYQTIKRNSAMRAEQEFAKRRHAEARYAKLERASKAALAAAAKDAARARREHADAPKRARSSPDAEAPAGSGSSASAAAAAAEGSGVPDPKPTKKARHA